jgi:hypothetical protein
MFNSWKFSSKQRHFLVDRRKQHKLQWLQDPSEANEDNLSYVRLADSSVFRKKKREYSKTKPTSFNQAVKISTSQTCRGA